MFGWRSMTFSDPAAAVKWPNVPACYGWLSLDRRGRWRLKGETISHAGLIAFINSRYGPDEAGNWIFRNGPQTVYVALDYTPLVLRLQVDGGLTAHTGAGAGRVNGTYLDDEGNALFDTAGGIGLLDDRDLGGFIADCRNGYGEPADEGAILAAMGGRSGVIWRGLPVQPIRRCDVPLCFGFRPDPAPC